jgi:hypothetical protein
MDLRLESMRLENGISGNLAARPAGFGKLLHCDFWGTTEIKGLCSSSSVRSPARRIPGRLPTDEIRDEHGHFPRDSTGYIVLLLFRS